MSTRLSFDLDVHYGFVDLIPADREVEDDLLEARGGQVNGLCGAESPGVLRMTTGLHTGTVPFDVEVLDTEPPVADEWQDVVEVSLTAPQCDYWLTTFDDGADLVLPVATSYRARYCATGMDEAKQGGVRMPDDPVIDRYLLQLWPASPRGDAVLRQTSQIAAYWHEVARTAPPPLAAPERAAAAAREAEAEAREEAAAEQQAEIASWGGSLPTEALLAAGASAQRLAHTHRRLADQIASLDSTALRQVAHWAASTACARAGAAALNWEPALESLGQGRPLPPPFDDPTAAWQRLYGPMQLFLIGEDVDPEAGTDAVTIHPPAAALATIFAAANPNPAAAAFDGLERAASAVHDPELLLLAVQQRFGLN